MPVESALPDVYAERSERTEDLFGCRFGRLLVLGYGGRHSNYHRWWWRCDCGNVGQSDAHTLKAGGCKSCGCLQRDVAHDTMTKHGLSRFSHRGDDGHPLYAVWIAMKQRCYNKRCKAYQSYGGRGITVCDRWRFGEGGGKTGLECLIADMGEKPSRAHSIGRIDNDGPYSPANCRWETPAEQLSNRRQYKVRKDKGIPQGPRRRRQDDPSTRLSE